MDPVTAPIWEIPLRLLSAALLGLMLGLDREMKQKPAGMRTYSLVSLGAAVFALVGQMLAAEWSAYEGFSFESIPIVTGVVGGVGFLGAGAITQARNKVEGITTAAGIWGVAAIGLACGIGAYAVGAFAAVFGLTILVALNWLERRVLQNQGDELDIGSDR